MPFHESAQGITVEDGHMLRAELANVEGEFVEAEFDLNDCIGNNNGAFEWGGGGTSSRPFLPPALRISVIISRHGWFGVNIFHETSCAETDEFR